MGVDDRIRSLAYRSCDVSRLAGVDGALIRAQGHALALLGVLLGRAGVVPAAEFARLLGLYAAATAETDPGEGDILACWAAMVSDGAGAARG